MTPRQLRAEWGLTRAETDRLVVERLRHRRGTLTEWVPYRLGFTLRPRRWEEGGIRQATEEEAACSA